MNGAAARRDGAGHAGDGPIVLLACAGVATPRVFPDDVLTCCGLCGASIYHRPHALDDLPAGARAACLPCAARYAREHDQPGWMSTRGITSGTLDEVTRYLHEHRQ